MGDTCVRCGSLLSTCVQAHPIIEQLPGYTDPPRRRTIEACSLACARAWSDENPWPEEPERQPGSVVPRLWYEPLLDPREPSPSEIELQRRMVS